MFNRDRTFPDRVTKCLFTGLQWGIVTVFAGMPILLQAQTQELEEIVVTAQKREQSIQDVSIAITAWSGEQISDLGLEASSDIARMTSGVHIASTSAGQDAQFTIRGVTQTDFSDAIEPPNAVYVDEGYMATTQGQRFGLFDLERVEVLKGPQGTLFGRNATGGLVHYITRKPTEEYEGYADVLYGSYNQVRTEAAVSGPLTANLSGRLSGVFNRHDSIIENVFPAGNINNPVTGQPFIASTSGQDDFWNNNSWSVRGQLLWKFNDQAEFLISAFGSEEDISTGQYEQGATTAVIDAAGRQRNTIFAKNDPQRCEAISFETGGCLPGGIAFVDGDFDDTRPVVGGDLFGFVDPGGGGDQVASVDHALNDFNEYTVAGTTGKLTWNFDNFTLTTISHFVHYFKRQSLDVDVGPAPQSIVMNDNDTNSFTQEIRLNGETDRSRWLVGFYYLRIKNDNAIGLGFSPDSPITLLLPFGPFESDSFSVLETNSFSLFGQVDYDLTDQLTFVVGARVIQEEKDAQFQNLFLPNVNDALVDRDQTPIVTGFEFPSFSQSTSDTLWSGKAVLEYRPNDDLMLYGGVNRGVKAGSFNFLLNALGPNLASNEIPYKEEVLLAYEVGFKSTLFNGTTRLNASFYYYDYTDYQGFVFANVSGFVKNVDATYKGAEFDITTQPVEGLELIINGSWIDATVENVEVASNVFRNVRPAHTPKFQAAGIARFTFPNSLFNGNVVIQFDFNYASSRFHNLRNFDAQKMDKYVTADARISWKSVDRHWKVSFFVKNLTDADYKTTGFDLSNLCGCNEEAYGKPGWFGGEIGYSWK